MQVPQSAKLYGLAKVDKPNIPMRPIVSFCGSSTYQLSKQLTNILNPLTVKSQHKLQSKDNVDAIKTVQIPDDHKLVTFDVKSLFTSIPLQLAFDCTNTAINKSHYQPPLPNCPFVCPQPTFSTTVNTTRNYMQQLWDHLFPLLWLK